MAQKLFQKGLTQALISRCPINVLNGLAAREQVAVIHQGGMLLKLDVVQDDAGDSLICESELRLWPV